MINLALLIFILVCLSAAMIILVRKFPALAALDIDTIKAEQEIKFKEQILSNRLKRDAVRWQSKITRLTNPAANFFSSLYKSIYNYLTELKEKYQADSNLSLPETEKKVELLFADCQELLKEEKTEEAEKRLIEIISLDRKNIAAFKELGDLYLDKGSLEEAKQTFDHAARLLEIEEETIETGRSAVSREEESRRRAEINKEKGYILEKLSRAYEADNDLAMAEEAVRRALAIEPQNPRRLDMLLAIGIMKKDKVLALDAYGKLEKANPENQKLPELKAKINEL